MIINPPTPVLLMHSELNLHTRCERQIENEINREGIRAGDQLQSDDLRREYPNAEHRPTGPSRKYNCHGLTFGARRTFIRFATEIAKILDDDDYEQVALDDVLPGDAAVYYENGDAEHSGIVMRIEVRQVMGLPLRIPWILSKWAVNHEVIHRVAECPYRAGDVRYYRISR
jgi:hypothetical protein